MKTVILKKARKIYDYLQNKVRYISIQIGIGGWKPMLASDVDKLAYGDCKGLTNYTKALLDAVGIPSYYTIIHAGEEKSNMSKDFTRIQGNHVILGVPDGDDITWLECTSQTSPFGYMGTFTDDRDVLIIKPDGGEIVRTKRYETNENIKSLTANVILTENLTISGIIEQTSSGLTYEDIYLVENRKEDEIHQFYKNRWGHLNNLELSSIKFENDKREIIFHEKMNFEANNYVSKAGSRILFCPNVFNRYNTIPDTYKSRKYPLVIHRGKIFRDEIKILLPDNYKIDSLFDPIVLESAFGTYRANIENGPNGSLIL